MNEVFYLNTTPASVTGTLVDTTLASVVIPGGTIKAGGILRIFALFSYTNSANTKTLNIKFGGTTFRATPVTTTASDHLYSFITSITNTSQVASVNTGTIGLGATPSAHQTGAVDITADQTLAFTAQLTNTGETITFASAAVSILNP